MLTFAELVESRKAWIEDVLKPWCVTARRTDLRLAAEEWLDIAGKVDAESTLWTWAWSRFPELIHEGLPGLNETLPVKAHLSDGQMISGFPDRSQSENGQLVLYMDGHYSEPTSIDEIVAVEMLAYDSEPH